MNQILQPLHADSDADLSIETYAPNPIAPNQPKPSRLRKLELTVTMEYLMPESGDIPTLKDTLEEMGRAIVTNEGLVQGTDATVDIRAYGVKEIAP